MPIEHITAGRKYTERRFIRQEGDATEEDRQEARPVWDALREAVTLEGKLKKIVEVATGQLDRSGLPHDPHDPIYSDGWVQQYRYKSLDWYARQLLLMVLFWRDRLEQGDEEGAMAECIGLGALFHEFCTVRHTVQRQSKAGSLPKQLSGKRQEWRDQKAQWREQAPGRWDKHPNWSARRVAMAIAPDHEQSCRKAIADLDPNRRHQHRK